MLRLADTLDYLNNGIGRAVSWLLLALALVQFTVVVLRYTFGTGSLWLQESILYLHATVFLLAAGYATVQDAHVRVSIWYDRAGPRFRATVDLLGGLFMLMPFAGLVLYESVPYVQRAWAIREGSPEASGLPAIYLLKTLILAYAVLLGMAGIAGIIRNIAVLRGQPAR